MDMRAFIRSAEARVATGKGQRYLMQLCKHFQHRLPVTLGEGRGRIEFPAGVCELETGGDGGMLIMRVAAADEAGLATLEDVVARHLMRFAFRDAPDVKWARTG